MLMQLIGHSVLNNLNESFPKYCELFGISSWIILVKYDHAHYDQQLIFVPTCMEMLFSGASRGA